MFAELDPLFLAIAIGAFFIGGIFKGTLGFGLPLLAIPAMTAAHSLPMALSIAVFPVFATNVWQTWSFRAHWQPQLLPMFLATAAVGLMTGAILLTQIREAYLEVALGVMVLLYLATRNRKSASQPDQKKDHTRLASFFGFAAGTVHGATGLSGLVGTPYFHALRLPRPAFILCNAAMFTLFSLLHGPLLGSLGLYQTPAIGAGLLTLPAAFLGLWLGSRIGARLNAERFSVLVVGLLCATAAIPIWNGLTAILG